MRQSELVSLDWQRISLSGRYAYLPMTKNGTARGVPLSSRAIEILATLSRGGNGAESVFAGVTAEAVKRAFHPRHTARPSRQLPIPRSAS